MTQQQPIMFSGGGTLGPVTPLLALAQAWRKEYPERTFVWVGTPSGPERALVERAKIPFFALPSPKFSRHQPWMWPTIPFLLIASILRSRRLLGELHPAIVISAGGYVSVPLAYAARLQKIPVWIHQLDVLPLLANRLMAPLARHVSVTWESSLQDFPLEKTSYVGALVRPEVSRGDAAQFKQAHGLQGERLTVLVIGGGTGARALNDAIDVTRDTLLERVNIIHLTGLGKMTVRAQEEQRGYAAFELLDAELPDAFAAADLVVARAGMGTLMEVAALGKPTILVPIPDSVHQVANARAAEEKEAAIVLVNPTPQLLQQTILHLADNPVGRARLSHNISALFETNAASHIVRKAEQLLSSEGGSTHLPDRNTP